MPRHSASRDSASLAMPPPQNGAALTEWKFRWTASHIIQYRPMCMAPAYQLHAVIQAQARDLVALAVMLAWTISPIQSNSIQSKIVCMGPSMGHSMPPQSGSITNWEPHWICECWCLITCTPLTVINDMVPVMCLMCCASCMPTDAKQHLL